MFDDILAESATVRRMEPPAEVIRTPLLPHQQEALAWMVDRENNDRLPPFWEVYTPKGKVLLSLNVLHTTEPLTSHRLRCHRCQVVRTDAVV
jgi:hypothetical protein